MNPRRPHSPAENSASEPRLVVPMFLVALLTLRAILEKRKLAFLLLVPAFPPALSVIMKIVGVDASNGFYTLTPVAYCMFVVPLLALFLGVSAFRDDIDNRTIRNLITRPIQRDAIYLGKFLSQWLFLFSLTGASLAAAWLPFLWNGDPGATFRSFLSPEVGVFALVLAGELAIDLALFLFIGLFFSHPMILGIAYLIVVEVGFSWLYGPPARLAVSYHVMRLLPADFLTPERIVGSNLVDSGLPRVEVGAQVFGLLGVFFLLVFLGLICARHLDVQAGDDE